MSKITIQGLSVVIGKLTIDEDDGRNAYVLEQLLQRNSQESNTGCCGHCGGCGGEDQVGGDKGNEDGKGIPTEKQVMSESEGHMPEAKSTKEELLEFSASLEKIVGELQDGPPDQQQYADACEQLQKMLDEAIDKPCLERWYEECTALKQLAGTAARRNTLRHALIMIINDICNSIADTVEESDEKACTITEAIQEAVLQEILATPTP